MFKSAVDVGVAIFNRNPFEEFSWATIASLVPLRSLKQRYIFQSQSVKEAIGSAHYIIIESTV